ncbi:hypothetical protein B296_00044219 [Ensete ventricosum]|uniref:DUF4005 domain-containing protein n=1 Tax=Ensete ventricosum TaxID=4639 RepID=A0A426ZBQ9_ENSVE|nr:hypothetical protein B296_00044219 [Ensete ventricosum]
MPSYFVAASVVLAVRCATCLLATGEGRSCPPYPCQVGRMMADPPMLVSGRAQSRRVDHIVGLDVRRRRDVAARSTFKQQEYEFPSKSWTWQQSHLLRASAAARRRSSIDADSELDRTPRSMRHRTPRSLGNLFGDVDDESSNEGSI